MSTFLFVINSSSPGYKCSNVIFTLSLLCVFLYVFLPRDILLQYTYQSPKATCLEVKCKVTSVQATAAARDCDVHIFSLLL